MNWFARSWFALAILALVILALPAIGLFGLWVTNAEFAIGSVPVSYDAINKWAEENYRLSFHISLPVIAAAILFLVPFLLILLYFLKLKRKSLSVPSTFLWKKSIEDLHVNSLFQWIRKNILLLLQLLAILALIYSILAPRFFARAGQGGRYVVIVDNSASMSATDVAPHRLDQAKNEALAEIDAAGDSDAGMVIAFNSSAEIRQSFTTNKQLLKQAVNGVEPTKRPTRIEEALTLADSLANPTRSTEDEAARPAGSPRTYVPIEGTETAVHLFSDGRFADAAEFAVGNLRVQFHSIGKPGPDVDNIGIVSFSASRDEFDPTRLFAAVRVLNFRNKPATVKVELQVFIDGRLEKAYDKIANLPKRIAENAATKGDTENAPPVKDQPGEAAVNFELQDLDDRQEVVLRASLANNRDDFSIDDEAFIVVGVIRKAQVLIVGPPNSVLDAFFDDPATKLVADVTKLPKDGLTDRSNYRDPAQKGLYDLVIFDRCAPATEDDMPQSNTLFIGRPPPPWKMPGEPQPEGKTVERVSQPAVKGWVHQHGLLRYLTGLHEVGIFEALKINGLPPRTPKLMESDRDLLLMFSLSRGPYTDAVMAFGIFTDTGDYNTNWPVLTSFPLFLRNVLYTLGNISDATAEENTQPGQVKSLKPGPGIDKINVTPPIGKATALERGTRAEFAYGATDATGVYQVQWTGGARRFAVNLLDPDESNLEPRPSITLGAETIKAGVPEKRPRDLWKWLVLAGLAVVLLEWYVYNKRVFV